MKDEKELIWIFKLLTSEYAGGFLRSKKVGCMRDFEKIAEASENDKDFRDWIKLFLIYRTSEKRGAKWGSNVKLYELDVDKMFKKMRDNCEYPIVYRFFDKRSTAGLTY